MTQSAAPDGTAIGSADSQGRAQRAVWLRVGSAVAHRWPTLVALSWAAISLADVGEGLEYTILFILPATGYLFLAVVDRPRITWAVVPGTLATVVSLRLLDIDPWPVLSVVAVTLVAVGLIGGQLRRPGLYAIQPWGALAFFVVGLVVLTVPAAVGGYLVALGLLGHATWDLIHWRADKIVARSFAEWCGVLDLVLGLGIMAVLTMR